MKTKQARIFSRSREMSVCVLDMHDAISGDAEHALSSFSPTIDLTG
jgi:hypothetical protein